MSKSSRSTPLPVGHPGRTPTADSIWRCPCGYEGKMSSVAGHRRGLAIHPEQWKRCAGDLEFISQGSGVPFAPYTKGAWRKPEGADATATPTVHLNVEVASPEPDAAASGSPARFTEVRPDLESFLEGLAADDPEAVARELNRQRTVGAADGGSAGGGRWSSGAGFFDGTLPPDHGGSEWEAEPPAAIHEPTQDRVTVALPVVLKVWYDLMVRRGWKRGDGSFSAWVIDGLTDHILVCCDLGLFAARRSELYPEQTEPQGVSP